MLHHYSLWSQKLRKKLIQTVTLATSLTLGLATFSPAMVRAEVSSSTVVVHPADMATSIADVVSDPTSWFFYNDETDAIDNSLGSFAAGPSTPPAGNSSVQISVSGSQRRNLATYQFSNVKLADITTLKFSTYNRSSGNPGSPNRSGYLNFNVSFDGVDNWQRRLVFLPSDNGTVQQNTWQEWDAVNGGDALYRYSGPTWPGTSNAGTTPRTLSDLISSYPEIRTRTSDPWLGVRVGEPYADGYTENIDLFTFGTADNVVSYDFEAYPRSAAITSPADGSFVSGMVDFTASLNDDDADAVQWAVRSNSCTTNTLFGNVDTKTDVAAVDSSNVANQTFAFSADMSGLADGMYCFVYNPVEDAGETNIRLTRQFTLDNTRPEVAINSPSNGDEVRDQVDVYGTVSDANARRHRIIVRDSSNNVVYRSAWIEDMDGLTNEVAGTWDTTTMADGEYRITLRAQDLAGNARSRSVTVTVDNKAESKDECKNDGWKDYTNPSFKNQGQCIASIQSNSHSAHHRWSAFWSWFGRHWWARR